MNNCDRIDCGPSGRAWQCWCGLTLAGCQLLVWGFNWLMMAQLLRAGTSPVLHARPHLHTLGLAIFALEWALLLGLFGFWNTDELNVPLWWTGVVVAVAAAACYGYLPLLLARGQATPGWFVVAAFAGGLILNLAHWEAVERYVAARGGRVEGHVRLPPVPMMIRFF